MTFSMKRMRVTLLFLSLFLPGWIFADTYTVMLRYHAATFRLPGYLIQKVVNAGNEDSCIGFAQLGVGNKKVAAFFSTGIADEISLFLSRTLHPDANAIPLILQINKLKIYEITYNNSEIGACMLNVSFIRQSGNQYTELLNAAIEIHRHGAVDVTGMQEENISRAFDSCFTEFNRRAAAGKFEERIIPAELLWKDPLSGEKPFPIMEAQSFPRGIYHSFYDFRDDKPDTRINFTVKYDRNKKDSLYVKASADFEENIKKDAIWGFSDGKDVFVRMGKRYVKLSREGNAWVTKCKLGEFDPDVAGVSAGAIGAAVAAGIMFGALGGAAAGALAGSSASSSNYLVKLKVDFYTGRPGLFTEPEAFKVEATTLFTLSKATAHGMRACLFINGKYRGSIQTGEYIRIVTPSKVENLDIRLVSDGVSYSEKIDARLFQTQVFLIKIKKGKSINLLRTFEQVRADLINGMTEENTVTFDENSPVPQGCL
jgi:hypothetical protein